ncbi:MAG: pilus assembly protein TadE, partial [Novosphingobium sp.]|nr:pilus assembly protein TadE [Novosphingobium sp.]
MIQRAGGRVRRLWPCRSGVSTLEFALIMPFVMSIGLYGVEVVYLNTIDMKLSEMALSLADNASRLGQTDNSAVTPTVTETDINEVMQGVEEQGAAIGFAQHGRVILSSLERDSASGKQYIHWQRCSGG